ncbi:hypothetical protein J5N97_007178 [Dioscorea zingiberensis]|uniref:Uncharacterized protein n=1 Tax=Dioscorea zingiberensis TaxID=325984 RepID=A0A9D5DF70_9LILI|nr:hypothetical protein J5N97_007178 [Dioscorea zingiberensis]
MVESSAPNLAALLLALRNLRKALFTYSSASFTVILLPDSWLELLQKYSPLTAAARATSSLWNSDIRLSPSGAEFLSGQTSGIEECSNSEFSYGPIGLLITAH